MCPPFVGKNYRKGGLAVIPINPGGGNATSDIRNKGDNVLYPVLHQFKALTAGVEEFYWNEFVPKFKIAKISFPIYRKMEDILEASETSLDDICYFNFLPYRGKDNAYPQTKSAMSKIIPNCIDKFVQPALQTLQPSLVVTFGKQVDTYIKDYWKNFPYETVSWNRARALTPDVRAERENSVEQLRKWANR